MTRLKWTESKRQKPHRIEPNEDHDIDGIVRLIPFAGSVPDAAALSNCRFREFSRREKPRKRSRSRPVVSRPREGKEGRRVQSQTDLYVVSRGSRLTDLC